MGCCSSKQPVRAVHFAVPEATLAESKPVGGFDPEPEAVAELSGGSLVPESRTVSVEVRDDDRRIVELDAQRLQGGHLSWKYPHLQELRMFCCTLDGELRSPVEALRMDHGILAGNLEGCTRLRCLVLENTAIYTNERRLWATMVQIPYVHLVDDYQSPRRHHRVTTGTFLSEMGLGRIRALTLGGTWLNSECYFALGETLRKNTRLEYLNLSDTTGANAYNVPLHFWKSLAENLTLKILAIGSGPPPGIELRPDLRVITWRRRETFPSVTQLFERHTSWGAAPAAIPGL